MTEYNQEYYEKRHQGQAYKRNNWLLDEPWIKDLKLESILEIGCGNGKFLETLIGKIPFVYGVDWVKTDLIKELEKQSKLVFFQMDGRVDLRVRVDLVVSADYLEHLRPEDFPSVLKIYDSYSPKQYHKIACYPSEGHTMVRTPQEWESIFKEVDPAYSIDKVSIRKNKQELQVVCIGKGV